MKIAAKDEYACFAVLELALRYDPDTPIRVQQIADRQNIPAKFLFQIMQVLKRVDLVRSKRGTDGGYVLARPPEQITVGDVIRSMSGPLVQLACLETGDFSTPCDRETTHCQFKSIWADVDQAIANILDNITFSELVQRVRKQESQAMYHI